MCHKLTRKMKITKSILTCVHQTAEKNSRVLTHLAHATNIGKTNLDLDSQLSCNHPSHESGWFDEYQMINSLKIFFKLILLK